VSADRPATGGKRKDIHERALGLLAVRQRTRRELERRLVHAGFDRGEVDAELQRLEVVGLVDDQAFAAAVVESRIGRRGESRRAVAGRLAAAGVDRSAVELALEDAPGDDDSVAERVAAERAGRLRGLDPQVAYQRLSGFLARRGFAPDVARHAARRALDLNVEQG